ncbi:MAG: DUF72 domain-containing protein [Candidatus Methylomirabilales bacterium]
MLFQLPASFRAYRARMARFLALVGRDRARPRIRPPLEFRHPSWFTEATFGMLRETGAALCVAHSATRWGRSLSMYITYSPVQKPRKKRTCHHEESYSHKNVLEPHLID